MKILLAGYNIDREIIDEIKYKLNEWKEKLKPSQFAVLNENETHKIVESIYTELAALSVKDNITPETVSAAYARISRNPAPVNELRRMAREEVDNARKLNRNIIFELGHSSVAEHAVFNIDVIGVSRYIIEEIEKFRLNAYTEKSQRYILLDDDYVIPEEINNSTHLELFNATIKLQNNFYHKLYEKLLPYVYKTNTEHAGDDKNKSRLEGLAKEDARYVLSLACEAQLGMTINARNLELMLSRAASHPLAEVREFSEKLFSEVSHIAPSVIKYPDATDYFTNAKNDITDAARPLLTKYLPETITTEKEHPFTGQDVKILQFTPQPHILIAASLIFSNTNHSMQESIHTAMKMQSEELLTLVKASWRRMKQWDSVMREFENVTILYEIVLSASCFGQLKRHRMTTQLCQGYDPELDVTVPDSILAVGMENEFRQLIDLVNEAYYTIKRDAPHAAPYILTNAHRKRILLQANVRELYHISRLREDIHAQWDIRNIAGQMIELAGKAVPVVLEFACGKDRFNERKKELFLNSDT